MPAAHSSSGPVARSTTVDRFSRSRTEVSVFRDGAAPKNRTCLQYCARLIQCRDEIGYIDPALPREELFARCEADEDQCARPTKEADCCAALTDCQSFARCQALGGAQPSACEPGRGAKKRTIAEASCPLGGPSASL